MENFNIRFSVSTLAIKHEEKYQDIRPALANLPVYVDGKIIPQPGSSDYLDPANLTLAIAVNGIIRTTTQPWEENKVLNFLCRLPPESFQIGANDISVYGVAPDVESNIASLIKFTAK